MQENLLHLAVVVHTLREVTSQGEALAYVMFSTYFHVIDILPHSSETNRS